MKRNINNISKIAYLTIAAIFLAPAISFASCGSVDGEATACLNDKICTCVKAGTTKRYYIKATSAGLCTPNPGDTCGKTPKTLTSQTKLCDEASAMVGTLECPAATCENDGNPTETKTPTTPPAAACCTVKKVQKCKSIGSNPASLDEPIDPACVL